MSNKGKTNREWLETLPSPYKEQAMENMDEEAANTISTSLAMAIEGAFVWRTSTQGEDYWEEIFSRAYKGEFDQPWVEPASTEDAPDMVNHPPHYTKGGIECIEAIAAAIAEDTDPISIYLKGTAIKYLWRYQHKGGTQDLHKAAWHIEQLIARRDELEQK